MLSRTCSFLGQCLRIFVKCQIIFFFNYNKRRDLQNFTRGSTKWEKTKREKTCIIWMDNTME